MSDTGGDCREKNQLQKENENMEHQIVELKYDLQGANEEKTHHKALAEDYSKVLEQMRLRMTPKPVRKKQNCCGKRKNCW